MKDKEMLKAIREQYDAEYEALDWYPEVAAHLDAEMAIYESLGQDAHAFRDGYLECMRLRHHTKSDHEEVYSIVNVLATSTKGAEVIAAMKRLKEIHKTNPILKFF